MSVRCVCAAAAVPYADKLHEDGGTRCIRISVIGLRTDVHPTGTDLAEINSEPRIH